MNSWRLSLGEWKASRGEDPTKEYEGAIGDDAAALKRNPGYRPSLANMGLLHGSMADRRAAVTCFERALEISEDPRVKPLLDAAGEKAESE